MILASLGFCLMAGSLGEYISHRFFMHRKGTYLYQTHTIEHHGQGKNEKHQMGVNQNGNFMKFWLPMLILNIPMTVFITEWHLLIWTIFQLWWFISWEYIHRAIHDESDYKWARLLIPWFEISKKHHMIHHHYPRTNYTALFWWTDYILGTAHNANVK